MEPLTPDHSGALARIAGHPLPAQDLPAAARALAEVLAMAERLDELDLDGVEPLLDTQPPPA